MIININLFLYTHEGERNETFVTVLCDIEPSIL